MSRAIVAVLLALAAAQATAQPAAEPIGRALALASELRSPGPGGTGPQREFDAALAEAARRLTAAERVSAAAREGEDLRQKLAAIAVDRADHAAAHTALAAAYLQDAPRPWRSQASPHVRREHVTGRYRLAWEYLLLAPAPPGAAPLYERRAAEALERIGDPRSAITLRHMLRVAVRAERGGEVAAARLRLALKALAGLPSPEAASALAEGMALLDAAGPARHLPSRAEATRLVAEQIAAQPAPRRDAWGPVLRRGAAEGAPELRRLSRELRTRIEALP